MIIECVPLPKEVGDMSPIYFKVKYFFQYYRITVGETLSSRFFFSLENTFTLGYGLLLLTTLLRGGNIMHTCR